MPTCGRSSATTIFVREAGTGWTSAGAAANKCSNREAASNLERGNGLRMDDPVQDKDLRVDGRAQGNGLRADGPVQDNDLRVDGRAQGNGLRADGPVQDNDLPVPDQAAAMRLGTLVLVERPSPKVREVVQVSAAVVAACEVVAVAAFEAAAAASEAAVAVVVAAVVVAADGDRISRSSTMSFSSAISPTASAFIASSITVASAPM
jgi:hypothetical protein